MCHDQYAPCAPILAMCPHCDTVIPGTPNYSPAMLRSYSAWECPNCGGTWDEARTATGKERFWESRRRVSVAR